MCDCLNIVFEDVTNSLPPITIEANFEGTVNGYNYWSFTYYGTVHYIWHDGTTQWNLGFVLNNPAEVIAFLVSMDACPIGDAIAWQSVRISVETSECECDKNEDRTLREFKSIKLPSVCGNEDRGIDDCCCEQLVLAKSTSNSWQTDKTSAWIKLSAPGDTVNFKLYKDGVLTSFVPTAIAFQNTANAFYTTINWIDVLNSDGQGCYELKIEYNISGITGSFTWGHYKLLPFTIQNALKTARIRAFFNAYHEIEQIDFTGSNVESTFRFYGYIGNRQPNTEIDNIIYGNREMKRVIRENLNEYEIYVDPSLKCITKPLIDLYFLSENELFVSDYNAHNHDYCISDLPVIVSQSPELTYYDFSRKASIKCIVSDKFKNQRTFY